MTTIAIAKQYQKKKLQGQEKHHDEEKDQDNGDHEQHHN
jgi:hypothetical protein